jgi:hypothetical protein
MIKRERDHLTPFNLSQYGFSKFSGIVILGSSSDLRVVKPKSPGGLLMPLLFLF